MSCQLRSSESAGLSSTRLASYATRPASASARDGKPALDDGTVLDVGNVIWATGFQPDYAWIELPVAAADGWPIEDRGVSAEEGLYFVGIPFQFGLGSILIHGAAKDAKYVVDRIAEQAGATVPAGRAEAVTA